tara:strand:- start:1679 stop:1852 length:174 start_codon:yes stop_codon:yes gene_type:complete
MEKQPYISKELLEYFEKIFPNELPNQLGITPEEVAFLQGQQSVIKRMAFMYDDDTQQ